MFKNLKKKLLVISNDAGGANQIHHYLKNKKIKFNLFAKGAAIKIFKKKNVKNLSNTILRSDVILFGSGTGTLEYNLLQRSLIQKKYTIVFLENWVNFKERLERSKNSILPNEVWISDNIAFNLAKKYFRNKTKIKKVKNYYLKSFKIKNKKLFKRNKIIYLSPNYDLGQITKKL